MNVSLRSARPQDQELLEYWDTKPHVVACDPSDGLDWEFELPRSVPWRELLIAEIEGIPIGFIQIIDPKEEETNYWGEIGPNKRAIDIWIGEESDLNKGYGAEMMQLAIARCFENPDVDEILIDPLITNTDAIRFYERIGFEFLEQRNFDGDECFIYRFLRSSFNL